MSANFLNVFEDERPDSHKQSGCISGLFQVFDRQHFLTRRRLGVHSQNNLPLGHSNLECCGRSPKTVLVKNPSQGDNQRTSSESSRNSFSSSSCSSSFSSVESSKPPVGDFRDIVKNSIYREENNGLSVKTAVPKESRRVVVKNKDSPRPPPLSKSMEGPGVKNGRSRRAPEEPEKSPSSLEKLKEGSWHFPEQRGRPREHTGYSCDGRDGPRRSLDSQSRVSSKAKELPRLSLDSRESSLKEAERRESNQRILRTLALHQGEDLEDKNSKRSPGVVARLMGLEALPTNGRYSDGAVDARRRSTSSPSPRASEERKPDRQSPSPKTQNSNPPWSQLDKIQMSPRKQESVYGEIAMKLNELDFQQSNKDLRALKQILDTIKSKGLLEAKMNEQKPSTSIARDPNSTSSDGKQLHQGSRNRLESPIVIMKPSKPSPAKSLETLVGLQRIPSISDASENKRASASKDQSSPRSVFRDGDLRETMNSTEKKAAGLHRRGHSSGETNVKSAGSSSPRMQQKKLALERKSRSEANKQNRQSAESRSPRTSRAEKKPDAHQYPTVSREMRNLRIPQDNIIHQWSDSNISLASQVDSEVTSWDQSPNMDFGFFHANRTAGVAAAASPSSITKHKNSREDHASPKRGGVSIMEQPSPVSVLNASFYRDESPASPVDGGSLSCGDDEYQNGSIKHLPSVPHPDEVDLEKVGNIASLVEKLQVLSLKDDENMGGEEFAAFWETESAENQYISEVFLISSLLRKDLSSAPLLNDAGGYPIKPEIFLVLEKKISGRRILESATESASKSKANIEKINRKLLFDTTNEVLDKMLESSYVDAQLLPFFRGGAQKISCGSSSDKHLLKKLCLEIEQLKKISLPDSSSSVDEEEGDFLKPVLNRETKRQTEWWSNNGREVPSLLLDIENSIFEDLIDEL